MTQKLNIRKGYAGLTYFLPVNLRLLVFRQTLFLHDETADCCNFSFYLCIVFSLYWLSWVFSFSNWMLSYLPQFFMWILWKNLLSFSFFFWMTGLTAYRSICCGRVSPGCASVLQWLVCTSCLWLVNLIALTCFRFILQ